VLQHGNSGDMVPMTNLSGPAHAGILHPLGRLLLLGTRPPGTPRRQFSVRGW
jgi:hypothetical protein